MNHFIEATSQSDSHNLQSYPFSYSSADILTAAAKSFNHLIISSLCTQSDNNKRSMINYL